MKRRREGERGGEEGRGGGGGEKEKRERRKEKGEKSKRGGKDNSPHEHVFPLAPLGAPTIGCQAGECRRCFSHGLRSQPDFALAYAPPRVLRYARVPWRRAGITWNTKLPPNLAKGVIDGERVAEEGDARWKLIE